ncbi:hypothetical protein ACUMLB_004468 [Escherichia coli]|nr:hypothetical protein [Escherichia coli]EJI0955903.1 hypothetical protein [Escherichia coli]EKG6774981.1 hypothetical protein [Escherichia coli]ELX1521848.1 hypothetical protein [Escherichia coli]
MSHFSVLVIGNNPKASLAPYHEFECTGINDEYIQEIDISEEIRGDIEDQGSIEEAIIYNLGDDCIVSDESELDLNDQHKFGYAIVRGGELIKAVRRTNPNKQWDWYVLGGRWGGLLLHKNGKRVDTIKKGDLDIEGAVAQKAIDAKRSHEAFMSAIAGHEFPRAWSAVREEFENIDEARAAYNAQPAIKAIKGSAVARIFGGEVEYYGIDEQLFVSSQVDSTFSTYAIIHENKWISKGEMGWWGCSTDNMSQGEWNKLVNELINKLPDDTLLSVYDCHI